MRIQEVRAREILDSRGEPTLEVTMITTSHQASFSVPSGKSTGAREAKVIRSADGSMRAPLASIISLHHKLVGQHLGNQAEFDHFLTSLDATSDKHELGGNTLLALSGAYLRLSAAATNQPLWRYIADWAGIKPAYPRIYANVVNGGKHAPGLDIQEFMVVPPAETPMVAIRKIREIYHALGDKLVSSYGAASRLVGDEGGYAPTGATHGEIWQILNGLSAEVGCQLACDAAATSFLEGDHYRFENQELSRSDLAAVYQGWDAQYDLLSVEDPFGEDDTTGFELLKTQEHKFFVVGDDLTTTQASAVKQYGEAGLIGGVIIKPNQIGTFSEAMAAIQAAKALDIKVIISHRSGETLDDTIADLAVGVGAFGIKIGAPARGERITKYNRLMHIEEEMV